MICKFGLKYVSIESARRLMNCLMNCSIINMAIISDVDNRTLFLNYYDEAHYPSYHVKVLTLAVQIVLGVLDKMIATISSMNFLEKF